MSELFWTASCLRNWLWFSHLSHPLKVGVHCSSLGSIYYEIAGKATTLLLSGKQIAGAGLPFSARDPRPAHLEGEKCYWSWSLFRGTVELLHRPSGRRVNFHTSHCVVQDADRELRLDCDEAYLDQLTKSPLNQEPEGITPLRSSSVVHLPNSNLGEPVEVTTSPEPTGKGHWTDKIPDESFRRVLKHLERHGTINEEEVTEFLGSPRLTRSFNAKIQEIREEIPFKIEIDTLSSLKVYRKAF